MPDSNIEAGTRYWDKLERMQAPPDSPRNSSLQADFEPVVDLPPESSEDRAARAELAASEEDFDLEQKLAPLFDELGLYARGDTEVELKIADLKQAFKKGTLPSQLSTPEALPGGGFTAPAGEKPTRETK